MCCTIQLLCTIQYYTDYTHIYDTVHICIYNTVSTHTNHTAHVYQCMLLRNSICMTFDILNSCFIHVFVNFDISNGGEHICAYMYIYVHVCTDMCLRKGACNFCPSGAFYYGSLNAVLRRVYVRALR